MAENNHEHQTVDYFDRKMGELHDLPDVTASSNANVTDIDLTSTRTYVVRTLRHRELGDYVFLVVVDGKGSTRLVIPPKVADAIARQRESVSARTRRKIGQAQAPRLRQLAAERKAAGIAPAFLKSKKRRSR